MTTIEDIKTQGHIAIFCESADLAAWVAKKLGLERKQWVFINQVQQLFGLRDTALVFYGDYWNREDFDEVWEYWKRFIPGDCPQYVLEQSDFDSSK